MDRTEADKVTERFRLKLYRLLGYEYPAMTLSDIEVTPVAWKDNPDEYGGTNAKIVWRRPTFEFSQHRSLLWMTAHPNAAKELAKEWIELAGNRNHRGEVVLD